MSANDNRSHTHLVERDVERGVDGSVGRIGRYQIADVADDVEVTGPAGGDDVGHDPRVGTREEHRIRSRRIGQLGKPGIELPAAAAVVLTDPVENRSVGVVAIAVAARWPRNVARWQRNRSYRPRQVVTPG